MEQINKEIIALTSAMYASASRHAKNCIIVGYENTIATQGNIKDAEIEIINDIPTANEQHKKNNFEIIVVLPRPHSNEKPIDATMITKLVSNICGVIPTIVDGPQLPGSLKERLQRDKEIVDWILALAEETKDEDVFRQYEEALAEYNNGIPSEPIIF